MQAAVRRISGDKRQSSPEDGMNEAKERTVAGCH